MWSFDLLGINHDPKHDSSQQNVKGNNANKYRTIKVKTIPFISQRYSSLSQTHPIESKFLRVEYIY